MPRQFRAVLICLMLFALAAGTATAQDYRGKVQGMVLDPSNAAVAGASVTLTNVNTGVAETRQSDEHGRYLFDFVLPGTYSLAVQAGGFEKFTRQNINVLTRGDVTVDAMLAIGGANQVVNVTADVAQVEFNTSSVTTTVQGTALKDMPVLQRSPYTLALLNPGVVNVYDNDRNPYYMWAATALNIGGATGGKNEIEMDGTSLNVSAKASYTPVMDSVQEVSVQQNAMDAEFGFSAGGTISLSTKGGTNEYHGTAYWVGRNPDLNAVANRLIRSVNSSRQNVFGGTIGNPIKKNKLFNYFSYERLRQTSPANTMGTVPTDAERTGDFSADLTPLGAQRVIYDPWTTKIDAATNTVTRTPFPGNIIPQTRMDPTGKQVVNVLWKPNAAPIDPTGRDNFQKSYSWWNHYSNLSDRVDYNINDRWRFFARYSQFHTRLDNDNWGDSIATPSQSGGIMDGLNASADVLWTVSPTMTVNFRYGASYMEDDYASEWAQVSTQVWKDLWPNEWWKNMLSPIQGIYYPQMVFGNTGTYTSNNWWWLVHGRSHNPTVAISKIKGQHQMKFGWQLRYSYDQDNGNSGPGQWNFGPVDTAASWVNYDANNLTSGSAYASALLGATQWSFTQYNPTVDMHQQQWGLYFQDDYKVSRNLTLNLGLRWERETAPAEQNRMLLQTMDLNNPIPELQNVQMPSQVTAIANIPYKYNGAAVFTSNASPRMYNAPWSNFLPRAGFAYRVNDTTAIRGGYARYAVQWLTVHYETNNLPIGGYSVYAEMLPSQAGVPQSVLSDPFPSNNPIPPATGQSLGRYTGLGNSVSFWNGNDMKTPMNDRFNFTVQHQAPQKILTEATFFVNLGHNVQDNFFKTTPYSYNLNQMDPNLSYKYQLALDQQVANPFYGMSSSIMPGGLKNNKTVSIASLLKPYPQYGNLNELGWPGQTDHYYALQLKAERPMANGLMMMVGYNYNREFHTQYFNAVDAYNNNFSMFDRTNPRHNLRVATSWEIPVGRGRHFLSHMNPVLDAVIGGWQTSQMLMFNSGSLLSFPNATVTGDPSQNIPAGAYFNPKVFGTAPSYAPRTNPLYYDGLFGPNYWQLDSTLSKSFNLGEKVKLDLRLDAYNAPNVFMASAPSTQIAGDALSHNEANRGREVQYKANIRF